jgi:hypothetical protein
VKSSNIRMSKCKSITTSGSSIELGHMKAFTSHNFLQIYMLFLFSNLWRTTSEEKRELERLQKPIYNSVRRAAEVHRQVKPIPLSNMFAA